MRLEKGGGRRGAVDVEAIAKSFKAQSFSTPNA
jgi:hypothetical protein